MIQGINGSIKAKKTKPIGPINNVLSGIHHHETPLSTIKEMDIIHPKIAPIINKHLITSLCNKDA